MVSPRYVSPHLEPTTLRARGGLRGSRNPNVDRTGADAFVTKRQLNKALIGGTRKYHTYALDNTYGTTGVSSKILGASISKGPDQGERQGDQINMLRWNVRFRFENTSAFFSVKIRVVCAEINRPTENLTSELFAPQGSDNTPVSFNGSAGTQAERKLYHILPLNPDKFSKIYYDKVFDMAIDGSETAIGYNKNYKEFSLTIPFGRKKISYTTNVDNDLAIFPQVKLFWFVVHPTGADDSTIVKGSYHGTQYYKT